MKLTRRTSAFTLIELLVVITIIGILITIAVPNLTSALDTAKMTQTLSNARSLQQATAAMSFDSLNSSDPDALDWTSKQSGGASGTTKASLNEYFNALTNGSAYLSSNDLKKLLTAPGKNPQVGTVGASNIAFNIYAIDSNSPSEAVFVATQNWTYGSGLNANTQPYGKKGFVFYTKGGGGGVKRKPTDATNTNDFPASVDGVTLKYDKLN